MRKPLDHEGLRTVQAMHFDDLLRALKNCHAALLHHPGGDIRDEADIAHADATIALAELAARQVRLAQTPAQSGGIVAWDEVRQPRATPEAYPIKTGLELVQDLIAAGILKRRAP